MESQKCVLYDRDCIGKCLDIKDYATIRIDRVVGISKTAAKHKK